jgi:hypothetical protein
MSDDDDDNYDDVDHGLSSQSVQQRCRCPARKWGASSSSTRCRGRANEDNDTAQQQEQQQQQYSLIESILNGEPLQYDPHNDDANIY